jgi:hypothetical protein
MAQIFSMMVGSSFSEIVIIVGGRNAVQRSQHGKYAEI